MKFARTLAKTVFTITLIACMFSGAAARTPSVEVVEPGAVGIDSVGRLPSLDMAGPLQTEILNRSPLVDMGFYPLDSDPTRKSLIWNAFPEPLQDEFFEKAPLVDMGFYPIDVTAKAPSVDMGFHPVDVTAKTPSVAVHQPLEDEVVRRTPSIQLAQPLEDEVVRRTPSIQLAQPLEDEVVRRTPSIQLAQPLEDEVVRKTPSIQLAQPLELECCGPTMHFSLKEAAATEIAIYSVSGRLVRRLTEALPSGESSLTWDGRDDRGSRAASGVYFARVQANGEAGKGKLVLVR